MTRQLLTWVLRCGGCGKMLDYIPTKNGRMTADGYMMVREAGWKYNGTNWECDGCLASPDEQERVFNDSPAHGDA